MVRREDYTVGWISAIPTEFVAAQQFLDVHHAKVPHLPQRDNNVYTLGEIGDHYVVMVSLPKGEYGTTTAATVARDMVHTFPNIRIGVMVGIGGGAPSSAHDIRLGDVVISCRDDGMGGVFQYDYGKTSQQQAFQHTQFLDQPPTLLRSAVAALEAQYKQFGHSFESTISQILKKNPRLRNEHSRPSLDTDRLFLADKTHADVCGLECSNRTEHMVSRPLRQEGDEYCVIHYGLIASANQLMKDAHVRDQLAETKSVLCFEMEAAGLMNHFPCLVVRGICDYSDTHKNKQWQGYAAMVAAAYAKDLLLKVPPTEVEVSRQTADTFGSENNVSEKDKHILQMFRLVSATNDTTYEWYKNRIEERVDRTCEWFLGHEHFQNWLQQKSGPLLVTADPGCGKSVLARYLIDQWLPKWQLKDPSKPVICYYFFKENEQYTVRQALCALLHQLFSQKPSLIKHAKPLVDRDGDGVVHSTTSLWAILARVVEDPSAGPVIIVLDALDECAPKELDNLVSNITEQFSSGRREPSSHKYLLTCRPYDAIVDKFHTLSKTFSCIHIPGESESEAISQEVNLVISHRLHILSQVKCFSTDVQRHLETVLKRTTHRTYLWVSLIFDMLDNTTFKQTAKAIDKFIDKLPQSVQEAYEQILSKHTHVGAIQEAVRKALSIILAAQRPLSLSELNIAMEVDEEIQSIHDFDLEPDDSFEKRLRSWCGLFVSVHHGKVYLIHQTARQFLLSKAGVEHHQWLHSISLCDAHSVMAYICMRFLNLFDGNTAESPTLHQHASSDVGIHDFVEYAAENWASHYRAAEVGCHESLVSLALRVSDPELKAYAVWFPKFWSSTFRRYPEIFTHLMVASYFGHATIVALLIKNNAALDEQDTQGRTSLSWAAANGHTAVVQCLLDADADCDLPDANDQTPLTRASANGYELVVGRLLMHSAAIESPDLDDRTPLSLAAMNGHAAVVELLLDQGAKLDSRGVDDCTPLWNAAAGQHGGATKVLISHCKDKSPESWTSILRMGPKSFEVARFLLVNGIPVDLIGQGYRTAISWVAGQGDLDLVRMLLEHGADVDACDMDGWTPLWWAAKNNHRDCVELLLDNGASVDAKDTDGRTVLIPTLRKGYVALSLLLIMRGVSIDNKGPDAQTALIVALRKGLTVAASLLITKGVAVNSQDAEGETPLLLAVKIKDMGLVGQLLSSGASLDCWDKDGWSPISRALKHKDKPIIKLLMDYRSSCEARTPEKRLGVNEQGKWGKTLLWSATWKGQESEVRDLLDRGALVDARDDSGRTPLMLAAEDGYEVIVRLLVAMGAKIDAEDLTGKTPLSRAAGRGHEGIVRLLLENDADVDHKDEASKTPLLRAARAGHATVVRLLLENSADANIKDEMSRAALLEAAGEGHEAVVRILLQHNANVNATDISLRTAIFEASKSGHEAVVRLLLEENADANVADLSGETPLIRAANNGHEEIVQLLVDSGANVEACDVQGRTALSAAAMHGHEAVVRLLLKMGANINGSELAFKSPLRVAVENMQLPVAQLLREKGARYFSK